MPTNKFSQFKKTVNLKYKKHERSKTDFAIKSSSMVNLFIKNVKSRFLNKPFSFIKFVNDTSSTEQKEKQEYNKKVKDQSLNYFTGKFTYKFNNPFNNLKWNEFENLNRTKKTSSILTGHEISRNSRFANFQKNRSLIKLNTIQSFDCHIDSINKISRIEEGVLSTASQDGVVKVWNVENKKRYVSLKLNHSLRYHSSPVLSQCYGNSLLFNGDIKGNITIFGYEDGQVDFKKLLQIDKQPILSMSFNNHFNIFASLTPESIKLWDVSGLEEPENFVFGFDNQILKDFSWFGLKEAVIQSFETDNRMEDLFIYNFEKQVKMNSFKASKTSRDSSFEISCFSVEEQKNLIATVDEFKTLRLIDSRTKKSTNIPKIHKKAVNSVLINNNKQQIISCAEDCSIKIWDLRTLKNIKKMKTDQKTKHNHPITMSYLKGIDKISIGYKDGALKFLDTN